MATGPKMTPAELATVKRVRDDFASGAAQANHQRLNLADEQISLAIDVGAPTVGRWSRRQRVPSPRLALRYARFIAAVEKALGQ